MARKRSQRQKTSRDVAGLLPRPEELLSFLEAPVFARAWKACALSDEDLFELQQLILIDPKGHPAMTGTGGLRKIRFSPTDSPRGKSGSHRACYVYYEEYGLVLLVTAYSKNEKDDLSAAARKAIHKMIEEQTKLLARGPIR